MFKSTVQKFSATFTVLCTLALCIGIIVFSKSCAKGAVNGIQICLSVLVPSLFPFMALSSFIVRSGLSHKIGKPFRKITNTVFGLDACFAPVILLSMIGGYPVGAKGISTLYENGYVSDEQASRAAMFCVCAGPGFLINYVGTYLYNNKFLGALMLASQILSMLIIGIVINILSRKKQYFSQKEFYPPTQPLSNTIVEAAYDSSRGILNICIFVVLFSAFTGILDSITIDGTFKNMIMCLLEVCTAVNSFSENCPIELTAFAIGFGGLCVHFQIFSALGKVRINKLSFFCIRIIQGVLTGLFTHLGIKLFVKEAMVFSTGTVQHTGIFGGTILSGLALIGISLCFLYTFRNQ